MENCRKNKYYLSSWVIWESVGQKWRRINVLKPVVKGVLGKSRIEMVTPGELRARQKKKSSAWVIWESAGKYWSPWVIWEMPKEGLFIYNYG